LIIYDQITFGGDVVKIGSVDLEIRGFNYQKGQNHYITRTHSTWGMHAMHAKKERN